jgi:hypothetical protein
MKPIIRWRRLSRDAEYLKLTMPAIPHITIDLPCKWQNWNVEFKTWKQLFPLHYRLNLKIIFLLLIIGSGIEIGLKSHQSLQFYPLPRSRKTGGNPSVCIPSSPELWKTQG